MYDLRVPTSPSSRTPTVSPRRPSRKRREPAEKTFAKLRRHSDRASKQVQRLLREIPQPETTYELYESVKPRGICVGVITRGDGHKTFTWSMPEALEAARNEIARRTPQNNTPRKILALVKSWPLFTERAEVDDLGLVNTLTMFRCKKSGKYMGVLMPSTGKPEYFFTFIMGMSKLMRCIAIDATIPVKKLESLEQALGKALRKGQLIHSIEPHHETITLRNKSGRGNQYAWHRHWADGYVQHSNITGMPKQRPAKTV